MGFIKAFAGALSGTFADQWKDFYTPMPNVPGTAAIFQAVPSGTNAGRGENTKGSENIISNGSKIVVPEGMALITIQDGGITACIAEPGGYIYSSDDPNSRSLFAGDGIISSTLGQSWDRFKFGGQPGAQQTAFYINLKEIPNNKFGTQNEIAFFDNFLQTQVSVVTRGTYSLKIVDPLLFVKNFVPVQYLEPGATIFDFADMDNDAGGQLFNEVVGCLGGALSRYTSDPSIQGSLIKVQSDQVGFAKSLSSEVEQNYQWTSDRGLTISKVAILGIDYDDETKELLKETRQDDREIRKAARMGQAYGNNMAGMMAAATAQSMQSAAANDSGAMLGFAGLNLTQAAGANMMGAVANMQQPQQPMQGQPMGQPQYQQPMQGQPMDQQQYQQPAPQQPVAPTEPAPAPMPEQPVAPVEPAPAPMPEQPMAPVEPTPAPMPEQPLAPAEPTPAPIPEQPVAPAEPTPAPAQNNDAAQKLAQMKTLLDEGLISQEDYDRAKEKLLGV